MTFPGKIAKSFKNKKIIICSLAAAVVISVCAGLFYVLEVPPVMAQSAVNSLPTSAPPQNGQKILIFVPHPDDETIGVGGYIAQAIQAGAEVKIVLVTDGDFHNNEATRYAEFRQATQLLGVPENNLVFLGFPDSKLNTTGEAILQNALAQQITQYNPDIVITPYAVDDNPDHAAIGKATEAALKADTQRRTVYEYLVHFKIIWPRPREYAPNYHLLPPKQLVNDTNVWESVPLSKTAENLKTEAVNTYHSQLGNTYLKGLLLSSIRTNELLIVPQNIYSAN
jgi:LmbE family N-acetylglucosaminyl deacetylase